LKKKTLIWSILLLLIYLPSFVAPVAAFDYGLTEDNLPDGFTLQSTTYNFSYAIVQHWFPPSSDTDYIFLSCTNCTTEEAAKLVYKVTAIWDFSINISISGANEASKFSGGMMGKSICARKKEFVILAEYNIGTTIEEKDVINLMKAQMKALPGSVGAPGFVLVVTIFGIAVATLIVKRSRR